MSVPHRPVIARHDELDSPVPGVLATAPRRVARGGEVGPGAAVSAAERIDGRDCRNEEREDKRDASHQIDIAGAIRLRTCHHPLDRLRCDSVRRRACSVRGGDRRSRPDHLCTQRASDQQKRRAGDEAQQTRRQEGHPIVTQPGSNRAGAERRQ